MKRQDSFAIGIPTINRYDLLAPTLEKYLNLDFPNTRIYVVDNGKQNITIKHPNLTIITPSKNLGVAGSWNILASLAYNYDSNVLILNDDVYLGKSESEIKELLRNESDADFIVTMHNWCAFVLPEFTFRTVGAFDAVFYPAYYEDNSYYRRLHLAEKKYVKTEILNPVVFRNSMTIQKDPSLNSNFEKNKQLYIKMWGGEPHHETFLTPYNK